MSMRVYYVAAILLRGGRSKRFCLFVHQFYLFNPVNHQRERSCIKIHTHIYIYVYIHIYMYMFVIYL